MSSNHSLEHRKQNIQKPKTEQIKKGLQKIKLAQIQVLRELRKDQPQSSRNCSLTYSKQSTLDSKPLFKFEPEKIFARQITQKNQNNTKQLTINHNKLKEDYLDMRDEARKNKEGWQKAEIKIKQYQIGEERALAQAQQALSNAIQSQKKYLTLKSENSKLIKEREKLVCDLKKIQKKDMGELIAGVETQHNIPNKIIKQLNSISDYFSQLFKLVHSHKCKQEEAVSPRNVSSPPMSFISSSYQIQEKVDHSINTMILYFHQIQNDAYINNKSLKNEMIKNDLIKNEVIKNDIKKMEQQKLLEKENKKIYILQKQINDCYQQIKNFKNKNKNLVKQLQYIKKNKCIIEQQYQKYKNKNKINQIKKQKIIQQNQQININNKNKNISQNPQLYSQRNIQLLQDRIIDLQKYNTKLKQKIKKYENNQKQYINIIQKLKNEIQYIRINKQQLQNQYHHQINKLNTQINLSSISNIKNNNQWQQIISIIKKLQQQRNQSLLRQNLITKKLQKQTIKYQIDMKDLQLSLNLLKQQIDLLRKQNINIHIDKTDLQRLRNQQNINKNFNKKKQKDINDTIIPTTIDTPFQPSSSTLFKFQYQEQNPRKSLDPTDRFLLSSHNTHSLMRLNSGVTNVKHINNNQQGIYQKQYINSYTQMPISTPSMALVPQSNTNLMLYQPMQYQQCFVYPHRINCAPQNMIQK